MYIKEVMKKGFKSIKGVREKVEREEKYIVNSFKLLYFKVKLFCLG